MSKGLWREIKSVYTSQHTGKAVRPKLGFLWSPPSDEWPEWIKTDYANMRKLVLAQIQEMSGSAPEQIMKHIEVLVEEGLLVPWEEPSLECFQALVWRDECARRDGAN